MGPYDMQPWLTKLQASPQVATSASGGLMMWAVFRVASIHYAADRDDVTFTQSPPDLLRHHPDVVDISHVSWVTGQAFTAVDLCAATLGRLYLPGRRAEASLSQFRPWAGKSSSAKPVHRARARLSPAARAWVRAVWVDQRYKELRAARHSLTHSTLPRALVRPIPPGHAGRTSFRIWGTAGPQAGLATLMARQPVPARDLIERARDVATFHVEAFVDRLAAGLL